MRINASPRTGKQPQPAGRNGMLAETVGLKSMIRTPKKALLFLLLLATAVTLLTLVLCVYHAVTDYLTECDQYYHTIAELTFMGAEYPDSHATDRSMEASLAANGDALQALPQLPGVIQFDAEDALLGIIPGLTRHDYQVYDKDAAVIVVTISWWDSRTASYAALICDDVYTWGSVLDKITYVALEQGTLQIGDSYVMCGHFITSSNNFLLFQPEDTPAGEPGSTQTLPGWQHLADAALPTDSPYRALARVFANRNNGYRVSPVTDLETLRPWQQGELKLLDGRLFTADEYAGDAQVCVISNLLSTVMKLSVGDTIPISLNDCENRIYGSWCETPAPAAMYRIAGIYYRTEDYPDTLFIPRSAPASAVAMTTGYTLGQFRLFNDLAGAFQAEASALLPPGYRLTVYDEGYGAVSGPYKELQRLSLLFLLICLLVVPGVLALYSYLFISRRRDTALLQRALGAGKAHVLRGFLAASLAVTLPAAGIGLVAARLLEGRVLTYVRVLAEKLGASDTRFSTANLFTVRHLEFAPATAGQVYLLAAAMFLALAILFTLLFSMDACHEKKPRRRKKPRAVHGRTSRLSGRLKYALLSIRRGGIRTLAVVLLCATVAVFLSLLTSTTDQYTAQLKQIEDSAVIRGYATDNLGRYQDGLVVPAQNVQKLASSGLTDSLSLSWQVSNLRLIGITRTADGMDLHVENPPIPDGGFAVETLLYKLSQEPKWIAVNSISRAPAFYYETHPALTWLAGYDETCLTGRDAALCVLPDAMMERNGITLGDTVRFLSCMQTRRETTFPLYDFLVVGSYVLPGGEELIYTPLGLAFPADAEPAQVPQREAGSGSRWEGYYDVQWLPAQLSRFSFRSMIFTLRSAADLDQLRNVLQALPVAQVGTRHNVRDYVLIDDAEYVSALQGMQRQMRYMNALFICLYAAIMLIGAVGAYLLQNARKPEIALMRALGVGPARILITFLGEQLLLSLLGLAAGVVCWRLFGGTLNPLLGWLAALYEASWMAGSALRIVRSLRPKAQELLTEPE